MYSYRPIGSGYPEDLRKWLQDPEFAAYFANAHIESGKELLRTGVVNHLTISLMGMSKTVWTKVRW